MPRARWISLTQSVGIPYSQLTVGVLKETFPLERRVVQSPESVKLLTKAGLSVRVQAGAGEAAIFSDADYEAAGATIVPTAEEVWRSDIVLKIRAPSSQELTLLGDRTLISMLNPAKNEELLEQLQKQKATAFSLDCIPRMLSRGQTFDAANAYGRFFSGQMTAAGKVSPAKVLVLGAGVAGLAAIQTAKNMGAIVRAYDVRPVVKEQVESLGGEFLKVNYEEDGSGSGGYAKEMSDGYKQAEAQLMLDQLTPLSSILVAAMKPGSVIVDLAAENGGNAVCTEADKEVVTANGVKCLGYTDLVLNPQSSKPRSPRPPAPLPAMGCGVVSCTFEMLFAAGLAGYQAVRGVPPALHSPLMSVTNAISGLTAVGAMLLLPARVFALKGAAQLLGAGALLLSAINIAV
ncbi:MAG: hypothetical protein SGPRY_009762 [Prymnesium sp.]